MAFLIRPEGKWLGEEPSPTSPGHCFVKVTSQVFSCKVLAKWLKLTLDWLVSLCHDAVTGLWSTAKSVSRWKMREETAAREDEGRFGCPVGASVDAVGPIWSQSQEQEMKEGMHFVAYHGKVTKDMFAKWAFSNSVKLSWDCRSGLYIGLNCWVQWRLGVGVAFTLNCWVQWRFGVGVAFTLNCWVLWRFGICHHQLVRL